MGFESHPRQFSFFTALGVLCCFALFVVCLTLLSFFLPSHLSFKNNVTCIHVVYTKCTCLFSQLQSICCVYRMASSTSPTDCFTGRDMCTCTESIVPQAEYIHVHRVSWVRVPPEAVFSLPWVCCVALPCLFV